MDTSKARTRSASKRVSINGIWEKHQELIREVHEILRVYGPPWYTEEIDVQLCEALAESILLKDKTRH
jgi:hypothetical protein